MTDSAIALSIFDSDKAVLATDVAAGVHTLKVTTANPTDGIVVPGFGTTRYAIGTVKTGSVHTICATTSAATDGIALNSFGTGKIVLGTVQSSGVHIPRKLADGARYALPLSVLTDIDNSAEKITQLASLPQWELSVADFPLPPYSGGQP